MRSAASRRGRGFTLPELLIVVAVLGVLTAVGMPSFVDFVRNQRVKTASFDLFSSLVYARSEAITRNATVKMEPISGAWNNGWTVKDASGNVLRTLGPVANVTITGPALGFVEYRGSGRLTAATMPTFQLTASSGSVTPRCISIDLSGRPTSKAVAC